MTAEAEIDARICEAFWQMSEEQGFPRLALAQYAQAAECTESELMLRASDYIQLSCFVLAYYDQKSLMESAADFADADDAETYEKILEGLIHRFEVLAPYRSGFDKLHVACLRDPALGMALVLQLQQTIGKLLGLSGDQSSGFIRMARIKGVFAVVMRVRKTWLNDHTADLSQTLNMLDKLLRDAQEWAVSLRVLGADEAADPAA